MTVAAMVALGLGIGANTAAFTLINAVLLQPLPIPDADRMVLVYRAEKEMMKLIATQLYEVNPRDPGIYAMTVAAVLVCALVACWVPARRATQVNPMMALQGD